MNIDANKAADLEEGCSVTAGAINTDAFYAEASQVRIVSTLKGFALDELLVLATEHGLTNAEGLAREEIENRICAAILGSKGVQHDK